MTLPEDATKSDDNMNQSDKFDSQMTENVMVNHSKNNPNQFSKPAKGSVSVIINQYKSSVKRWCNKHNFNQFQWHSRFYDQILHNETAIDSIREYICNNPKHWSEDELYNL